MEVTMRPTTATDNIIDINYLLHPGITFDHPKDIVAHPELSLSEKRAILTSWASDAAATTSSPVLRAPDGLKKPTTIVEILEALQALNGGPHNNPPHRPSQHPPGGKPNRLRSIVRALAA
jgi:hypothetical protein